MVFESNIIFMSMEEARSVKQVSKVLSRCLCGIVLEGVELTGAGLRARQATPRSLDRFQLHNPGFRW